MPETETFSSYLVLNDYSQNSIQDIKSSLRFFFKNYTFDRDEVIRFHVDCKKRGVRASTLNKYIANIKVYGRFKQVPWVDEINGVKVETANKVIMREDEITKFLELPEYAGAKDWERWHLFWKILAYTGARPNEVASLKDTDIDLGLKQIYIRKTKTRKARTLPIHPDLMPDLGKIGEGYLCNFTKTAWVQHFNRRLKRCGIKKRPGLTTYSLRHTVATSLLDADKNIYLVKNLLGHSKISTTEQYYHFSVKKLHNLVKALPYAKGNVNEYNIEIIKDLLSKCVNKGIEQKETDRFYEVRIYR